MDFFGLFSHKQKDRKNRINPSESEPFSPNFYQKSVKVDFCNFYVHCKISLYPARIL